MDDAVWGYRGTAGTVKVQGCLALLQQMCPVLDYEMMMTGRYSFASPVLCSQPVRKYDTKESAS